MAEISLYRLLQRKGRGGRKRAEGGVLARSRMGLSAVMAGMILLGPTRLERAQDVLLLTQVSLLPCREQN